MSSVCQSHSQRSHRRRKVPTIRPLLSDLLPQSPPSPGSRAVALGLSVLNIPSRLCCSLCPALSSRRYPHGLFPRLHEVPARVSPPGLPHPPYLQPPASGTPYPLTRSSYLHLPSNSYFPCVFFYFSLFLNFYSLSPSLPHRNKLKEDRNQS